MRVFLSVVMLLFLMAVPVLASEVHISDPAPLFCGSGVVRVNGTALVPVGDQYKTLKVYFADCTGACTIGEPQVVHTQTLAQDGKWKSWEVFVNVTQGRYYTVNAVLASALAGAGPAHIMVRQQVPACNDTKLQALIDLAEDRMSQP